MGSKILIINIGSASKKYSVFDGLDEILFMHFESHGRDFVLTTKTQNKYEKDKISKTDYKKSLEFLNSYLIDNLKINEDDISALAFRVVAPGSYFLNDLRLDDEYLNKLKKAEILDSLHISPVLEEVKKSKKIFKNKEFFAISDSSYFKNKLEISKYYGISKKIQDEFDYKRFGYHGISVQSVYQRMISSNQKKDFENKKILICHLGGGVSFTAISGGKVLDNSMGFSPLEGPIMATRSGNVDFILLNDFFENQKITSRDDKLDFLINKSGLLGISEISSDLRVLRDESFKGNEDARFAMKVYIYNLVKEINKMIGVMKGVDVLVFTGTIGFRADFIREFILEELRWLGIDFDLDKNIQKNINSSFYNIESDTSKVEIIVCETNEMEQIAINTYKILN